MKLVQFDDNDPLELPPKPVASTGLGRLVVGCLAVVVALGLWYWFG